MSPPIALSKCLKQSIKHITNTNDTWKDMNIHKIVDVSIILRLMILYFQFKTIENDLLHISIAV